MVDNYENNDNRFLTDAIFSEIWRNGEIFVKELVEKDTSMLYGRKRNFERSFESWTAVHPNPTGWMKR